MTKKTNIYELKFDKASSKPKHTITPLLNRADAVAEVTASKLADSTITPKAKASPGFSAARVLPFKHGSADWKLARYSGITATDIPVIMGESSYKTPYGLWLDKVNKTDDFEGNRQTEFGLHLESLVCRWVQEDLGRTITPSNELLSLKEEPIFMATIDAICHEDDELIVPLEIKTAAQGWENDEPPAKHLLQVQGQLIVTKAPYGYIACLPFGMANRLIIKKVVADYALQEEIKAKAREFFLCVQNNTPPEALAEDLSLLPLDIAASEYEPDESFLQLFAEFKVLEENKKLKASGLGDLEKQIKDIKAKMAQAMGEKPKAFFFFQDKPVTISRKEVKVKEKLTPAYSFQRVDIKEG